MGDIPAPSDVLTAEQVDGAMLVLIAHLEPPQADPDEVSVSCWSRLDGPMLGALLRSLADRADAGTL